MGFVEAGIYHFVEFFGSIFAFMLVVFLIMCFEKYANLPGDSTGFTMLVLGILWFACGWVAEDFIGERWLGIPLFLGVTILLGIALHNDNDRKQ